MFSSLIRSHIYKKSKRTSILTIIALAVMFLSPSNSIAAALTAVSDTLETSAFSTASTHTIRFTTGTALTTDGAGTADFSFVINLPTDATADPFTLPNLAASDITATCTACTTATLTVTAAEETSNGGHAANDELLVAIDDSVLNGTLPAGAVITLTIGVSATKLTNPANGAAGCTANAAGTADICSITIQTSETTTGATPTTVDNADVLVGLIEGVSVTATIDESLSFAMTGLAGASCTGDTGTPTVRDVSASNTAIPFGIVAADTFYVACQNWAISTNAASGYNVTVEENTNLRTAGGVNIGDTTCDAGTCTQTTGAAWATASANQGLGYWCENITGAPCSTAGDTTAEHRQFACRGTDAQCDPGTGAEAAQNAMSGTAATNTVTGRIHYKLSRGGAQAAGAYSNTVQPIATPLF